MIYVISVIFVCNSMIFMIFIFLAGDFRISMIFMILVWNSVIFLLLVFLA